MQPFAVGYAVLVDCHVVEAQLATARERAHDEVVTRTKAPDFSDCERRVGNSDGGGLAAINRDRVRVDHRVPEDTRFQVRYEDEKPWVYGPSVGVGNATGCRSQAVNAVSSRIFFLSS